MPNTNTVAESAEGAVAAVKGENKGSGVFGVWGVCSTGHGVRGDSLTSKGVVGTSNAFHGVYGKSLENVGVAGESDRMHGVLGICHTADGAGVVGTNDNGGDGIVGTGRRGVVGMSVDFQGVYGKSTTNAGLVGESDGFHAVFAISHSPHNGGVLGINDQGGWGVIGRSNSNTGVSGESDTGVGIHGKGGRLAGLFEGDVEITGDLSCTNADCAEDFDIAEISPVEPGTVMVLDGNGALAASQRAYDRCVAGVISGAGTHRPAIVLDKQPEPRSDRQPLALVGKVFCKVDAGFGAVAAGDLLTTSTTPGHAMVAADPTKAFGAVIGKALRPLTTGRGLIPILIALQ